MIYYRNKYQKLKEDLNGSRREGRKDYRASGLSSEQGPLPEFPFPSYNQQHVDGVKTAHEEEKEENIVTTLFVGNLSEKTNHINLRESLSRYGYIEDVYIPSKKDIKGMRFGLVRFKMRNEIGASKKMNGRWLCGSFVNINVVRYERTFKSKSKEDLGRTQGLQNKPTEERNIQKDRREDDYNVKVERTFNMREVEGVTNDVVIRVMERSVLVCSGKKDGE